MAEVKVEKMDIDNSKLALKNVIVKNHIYTMSKSDIIFW